MPVRIVAVLLLAAARAAAAPPSPPAVTAEDAIRFYDRGEYAEARTALLALDHEGLLDGPLAYRLFFCQRAAGDEPAAQAALDRARQLLEKANESPSSIEIPFYLANVYSNMGREAEARAIAKAATSRVESGPWKTPDTAIGLFQLAKLYQDQGRPDDAVPFYEKAVSRFDLKDGRYANNVRWALRYMGDIAFSRGDYASSEKSYSKLTDMGKALPRDWNALATARARQGRWEQAAAAWRGSVQADPAAADDPRYSARLAETAATIPMLPAAPPGGTAFKAMSREELEAYMTGRSAAAREVQKRAAEGMRPDKDGGPAKRLDAAQRTSLTNELKSIRASFVGACLEYALRGFPIRETAFRDGYAVQIFQDSEWQLPSDSER